MRLYYCFKFIVRSLMLIYKIQYINKNQVDLYSIAFQFTIIFIENVYFKNPVNFQCQIYEYYKLQQCMRNRWV